MKADALREFILKSVLDKMQSDRYSRNYIKEMNRNIRQFYNWAVKRSMGDIEKLGKKELLAYRLFVTRLQSKNAGGGELSISTMNSMLTAVKHVYSMLYLQGIIPENPLHSVDYKIRSGKQTERRPLTEKEITFFLENIDTSTELGLRDRTIFELIYSSGLRVSEAAGLKIGDIDFEKREAIVRGKFDRDRMVPLSNVAADFLKKYLGERKSLVDEYVFLGLRSKGYMKNMRSKQISRIFRTYLRKFEMDSPNISTHSVRHSTATHLLDNGASVRHVQELLGHKNIETTVRYTHIQTDGLYKIFRKYHPREHELFEMVDDDYLTELDLLIEKSEK
jgi:integrase/recombinase XerD